MFLFLFLLFHMCVSLCGDGKRDNSRLYVRLFACVLVADYSLHGDHVKGEKRKKRKSLTLGSPFFQLSLVGIIILLLVAVVVIIMNPYIHVLSLRRSLFL